MTHTRPPIRTAVRIAGALVSLLGLVTVLGGAWLVSLGGSLFYLPAGLLLLSTGVLLLMGHSAAARWLYALLLAIALVWALWEAGLDFWPLAARLDLLFLIGLVLLLPAFGAPALAPGASRRHARRASRARAAPVALALVVLVSAGVALAALLRDPHVQQGQLADSAAPAGSAPAADGVPPGEWHAWARTGLGQRYSPLMQVRPANVAQLERAWEYRTGDLRGQDGDPEETTYEVTPLKIGERLFLCTPHQSVIALDATSGKELWRYEPKVREGLALQHLTCRGLSYLPQTSSQDAPPATAQASSGAQRGPAASSPAPTQASGAAQGTLPIAAREAPADARCAAQLYMPTADGRLIALNPENGHVCAQFGGGTGQIDLWQNMPNVRPGAYYSTSPPVVAKGRIVIGGTVLDNASVKEQSGVIRGFDATTGELLWNWDSGAPDRREPLPPGQLYTANSPNSWSVSSVDEALGLVYVPMGNQPPDQWGGARSPASERYSSSVVALELETGGVRWHFQTVHHDLWDYDVPAQPTLLDLDIGGARVPALVQPTKQGDLYVLDRRTGTPLHAVTERPTPQGAAAGDRTAPTQPHSALSLAPAPLSESHMWGLTWLDQMACRIAFKRLRYEGRYTPPSEQGSLIYPGNFGVFNWGGIAVDPQRQQAFITPTYLAFVSKLVKRPDDSTLMVQEGGAPKGSLPALNENFGAPFAASMKPFLSPIGLPCQAPPWGLVAGVDLRSGTVAWRQRNGTVRDLSPVPVPLRMGVPGIGGAVLTASGVAFYSGALDNYVRAYDLRDGRVLWQDRLPAGGQATPMSYLGRDGRQYLVVVAGGHGSTGTDAGDTVRAYALPAPPAR